MVRVLNAIIIGVFAILLIWVNIPSPITFTNPFTKKPLTIKPFVLNLKPLGIPVERPFETKLGLDIVGGVRLVFQADTSQLPSGDREQALEAARDIIERRVNYFGVAEPVVQTVKNPQGSRITVDLPGFQDAQSAAALIGQTAQLSFMLEDPNAKIASDASILETLTVPAGLTGKDVKKANVVFDQRTGEPAVQLIFTKDGAEKFAQITKNNVGKPMGIFIDSFPISAPIIQTEITGGEALISGSFTVEGAKQLATAINSGALPLPVTLIQQNTIGPSLGADQVNRSLYAGTVGFLLLALFMVFLYRGFGVVALISLIIYALLTFAIYRFIPVTLTLSGLAGFILSLGMAVDANILIFERIKEEMRKGRDLVRAIPIGFGRAMDAIKDANITTLIVCFILFNPLNWDFLPQFGLVKGFALTLAFGVLMSLFTGVVVTRRLIKFFYKA